MGLEFLASFTNLIRLIGDLIPERIQIAPQWIGIKFQGMTKIVILREGCHWYWPIFSRVDRHFIGRSMLQLGAQYCLTKDQKTVLVDGAVDIGYYRSEKAIIKVFVSIEDVQELLCSKAMACVCDLVSRTDFADLADRDDFNERLAESIRSVFKGIGVHVYEATIETLATGRELLHIGHLPAVTGVTEN